MYIPGGTYAVSEPLLLKGSNSTWANQQWNATFGPIPVSGDGTGQTIIRAAASGKWGGESDRIAVLFFPTCCGALPQSGGGWHLADLSVDANNTVDYGILAPAVYSSSFQRIGVTGALVCGMHIGWGWCNMIEDSTFELNYIGLVLNNAVNNVNVINSAFLDNEVGLYISGGMQMNIEGNVFEGNGGPGAIVFDARALTLDSNYFEGNNGHERAMSGHPFTMVPEDLASGWSNITTTADIIFTGCPSFNDGNSWVGQPGAPIQRLPAWCFGKGYPSSAVIYSGNIHAGRWFGRRARGAGDCRRWREVPGERSECLHQRPCLPELAPAAGVRQGFPAESWGPGVVVFGARGDWNGRPVPGSASDV